MTDLIRVIRLLEYSGPREQVEEQLSHSMGDGTRSVHSGYTGDKRSPHYGKGVTLRIATLPASLLTEDEACGYENAVALRRMGEENRRLTQLVEELLQQIKEKEKVEFEQ